MLLSGGVVLSWREKTSKQLQRASRETRTPLRACARCRQISGAACRLGAKGQASKLGKLNSLELWQPSGRKLLRAVTEEKVADVKLAEVRN